MDPIEQLIRTYVHLPGNPSGTGWHPILCKICNDHGRKGPRGGFRFEDGGVAYHCFNCGHKATYYTHYKVVPDDMQRVFTAFQIPDEDVNKLRLEALRERDEEGAQNFDSKQNRFNINPKELALPDHFFLLENAEPTDKWAEVARLYLEDRAIDPNSYPFLLSTGIPKEYTGPSSQKVSFVKAAQKWAKRIIIPIFKDDSLIFYIGRDLTGKALKKYMSPTTPKDRVIFGFDELFIREDRPLYVVEGFFDAFPINGVAILGNELTEAQIAWLNKSRRDKVYIPDKYGDGARSATKALELGWAISTPDIGNCKDINEGIVKYGLLYIHNTLKEQTQRGFQAEAALNLYCKK